MTSAESPREWTGVLNVLVVSGGGFQGMGLVECLRDSAAIRVTMVDSYAENAGRLFVDRFYQVPPVGRREEFLASIWQVCRDEGIRLIFPSTHHEAPVLAEAKEGFRAEGIEAAVADPAFVNLASDKHDLYLRLEQEGLPVLPRVDPWGTGILPVIGKPRNGWGSRGIVILRSAEDLGAFSPERNRSAYVWQPYLDGATEVSVDLAVDSQGVSSGFGLRKRVRTSGGFAVISETVRSEALDRLMDRFLAFAVAAGARGLLNVQILGLEDRYYFSDVNCRLGTSAVHWRGQPQNPVMHLCRSLTPGLDHVVSKSVRRVRYSTRHLGGLQWEEEPAAWRAAEAGVRAVVFDLDDTLLDHKRWILGKLARAHEALVDALPERRTFLADALQLLEEGHSRTLVDALAHLHGYSPELRERVLALYRNALPEERPLFRDVLPTLESLKRRGLEIALLTDNPPATQRQKVRHCALDKWIKEVVYTQDRGAEKPAVGGFLQVAERLGLPPASLAMVGDNPHRDVRGAVESGYAVCYLVSRPGRLFGFDPDLFRDVAAPARPVRFLSGLQPLLWHLG